MRISNKETLAMALMSMIAGGFVLSTATWAFLGHPETLLGYPSGAVLLTVPLLLTLILLIGTAAFAYVLVWAVQTAPKNRPDVDIEYNETSTFDRWYTAMRDRELQLLLAGAIAVNIYYYSAQYLEAQGYLSEQVMLIVNVFVLLIGIPIAVSAGTVIWEDIQSSDEQHEVR